MLKKFGDGADIKKLRFSNYRGSALKLVFDFDLLPTPGLTQLQEGFTVQLTCTMG